MPRRNVPEVRTERASWRRCISQVLEICYSKESSQQTKSQDRACPLRKRGEVRGLSAVTVKRSNPSTGETVEARERSH